MTPTEIDHLAATLFRAFEDNDADTFARCCAPDAAFSRNGVPTGTRDEVLPHVATLRSRIGRHRYSEVRRETFSDGFVEEHRVDAVRPDGTAVTVYACVVARIDGAGLVRELAEYVGAPTTQSR
jgi:hypothetical protein